MTLLAKAIAYGDTKTALRLIRYPHPESIGHFLLMAVVFFVINPIAFVAYCTFRVLGVNGIDMLPLFSYLDRVDEPLLKGHPMSLAADTGNIRVLAALFDQGVDINGKGNGDITAIEAASSSSNQNVKYTVEWLVEHGAEIPKDILFYVVGNPKLLVLFDFFVQRGADVQVFKNNVNELRKVSGSCPFRYISDIKPVTLLLQSICSNDDKDHQIIAKLLKAGANPNEALFRGWNLTVTETALSIALRKRHFKMAIELMRGGAELDIMATDHRSNLVAIISPSEVQLALHLAAANNINLTAAQLGQYATIYSSMNSNLWPVATVIESGRNSSSQASLFQFGLYSNRSSNNPEQVVNQENAQAAIPDAIAVDTSTAINVPPFTYNELQGLRELRLWTYTM